MAAQHGAELAVVRANREGGFSGRPFELVVHSVEGPWGSGTGEITSLVFDESVWAILGPLHGRTAHLAEQVAAKGHVALVSPWASDPTLTQANVPWFFRCVPDDRDQAVALAREIFEVRGLERVAAIAADSYDARVAADALVGAARPSRVILLSLPSTNADPGALLDRLEAGRAEGEDVQAIALFAPDSIARLLVRGWRARGMEPSLFLPLSSADAFRADLPRPEAEKLYVVAPGHWRTSEGQTFERDFRGAYEEEPRAVAAYAYDGLTVIVEAVRRAGLDRQRIRDALADIDYRRGVTGRIRFDERGNRVTEVEIRKVVPR